MLLSEEMWLRLAMVVAVGGLIGAEREMRSRSAGFRTMILICLGSFLFTTFSKTLGIESPDRVASNIVTGIGFLGAGVIFNNENRINGITTAASIWAVAALGMGIAEGLYALVAVSSVIVLISLYLLTYLEMYLDKIYQTHTYRVVGSYNEELLSSYEKLFKKHKLSFRRLKRAREGDNLIGLWSAAGSAKNHNAFVNEMLHQENIKEFEF